MPARAPDPSAGAFAGKRFVIATAAASFLLASAAALVIAPAFMPESYSWVVHTTSESAAQGVGSAWIARLGFVTFGLAVILLISGTSNSWSLVGRVAHAMFGVLMIAAAVFSHRPWEPEAPFSETEDLLHSIAATGMGFAFAIGVVVVMLGRKNVLRTVWLADIVAVVASVVIPLAMMNLADFTGLFQRVMFAIAYGWHGMEIVRRIRNGKA